MNTNNLSLREQAAIPRILNYWLEKWDWECPTLFGLERNEFEAVTTTWPQSLTAREQAAALAVSGSLNELLNGASSVASEEIDSVCGLSHAELLALADKLRPKIDGVLGCSDAS